MKTGTAVAAMGLCLGLAACAAPSEERRAETRELGRILLQAGSQSAVHQDSTGYYCTGAVVLGDCHGTLMYDGIPVR